MILIKKAKKYINKIVTAVLCLLVCVEFVLPSTAIFVRAEDDVTSYDDTKIEDDLEEIDLGIYPANSLGKCDIVSFMEYCYSENEKYSEVYGLYIYVYNPTKKSIVEADGYNFVNISTAFDGSEVSEYESMNLEYLDKTDDRMFYKFKISNSDKFLSTAKAYAENNLDKRRYDIIELEVQHGSVKETTDISKSYVWSGYAVGCSPDESPISTLSCNNVGVRSVYLELMQTNYRFATQSDGYTKDELNSVFFTIPEEYFQEFGNLNNISAEWYEYKTKPMFVTSDSGAYRELWNMRNVGITRNGYIVGLGNPNRWEFSGLKWRVLWEYTNGKRGDLSTIGVFNKGFNPECGNDRNLIGTWTEEFEYNGIITPALFTPEYPDIFQGYTLGSKFEHIDKINWLFYVEDVTGSDAYVVPEKDVREYMKRYTSDFYYETKVLEKYADSLFETQIDSERLSYLFNNRLKDEKGNFVYDENKNIVLVEDPEATCGYVKMDFTAGAAFNKGIGNSFVDASVTQSAWNKFWFGTNYETITYSPIQIIKEADLIMSPEDFCELYYVNKEDAKTIIDNAKKAYENEERPVLLRFAVTDYYVSEARFDLVDDGDGYDGEQILSDVDGYVAQQTVFLDFDIISLGFQDDNGHNDVVIGVVSNPIDIIKGLTPPDSLVTEEQEWWQKIMMVLGIILIVVLLVAFGGPISFVLKILYDGLKFILSILLWILSLPFKIIGWLFKPK